MKLLWYAIYGVMALALVLLVMILREAFFIMRMPKENFRRED